MTEKDKAHHGRLERFASVHHFVAVGLNADWQCFYIYIYIFFLSAGSIYFPSDWISRGDGSRQAVWFHDFWNKNKEEPKSFNNNVINMNTRNDNNIYSTLIPDSVWHLRIGDTANLTAC